MVLCGVDAMRSWVVVVWVIGRRQGRGTKKVQRVKESQNGETLICSKGFVGVQQKEAHTCDG